MPSPKPTKVYRLPAHLAQAIEQRRRRAAKRAGIEITTTQIVTQLLEEAMGAKRLDPSSG